MIPEQQPPAASTPRTQRQTPVLGVQASRNRVVIVGLAADVPRALEHPAVGSAEGFVVSGVVTVTGGDELVQSHADSLHELLREHKAGIVLVAGPLGRETMRAVSDVAQLHGCRLLAVMPSEMVAGLEPKIVWEGESPLVQLSEFHRHSWQRHAKRALDVVGAAVGIVLLSPLFLAIALGIKLESRGPALFQHWRVGRRGRGFHCLKFRTMHAEAEEVLERDSELQQLYRENHYKLPEHLDPRVTRFGKFLRRTSLDELPQLFNVLTGEMSLIGPRPVVEAELEHFRGSERLLLSVRPGMTGAWAVNGRHHVGYPRRAELELRYVRSWSLATDLAIMAGTLSAVLDPGSDVE
jgi:exopolysaccharide production protein ExoY